VKNVTFNFRSVLSARLSYTNGNSNARKPTYYIFNGAACG